MNISWQWNTKTGKIESIENCELRPFWSSTSVQPGTTSIWRNEMLVVSLNEINTFYNCHVSYKRREKVIVIDS